MREDRPVSTPGAGTGAPTKKNLVLAAMVFAVAGFASASAACGFTPKGSIAEAWIIFFRVAQGATAALLFPAAVAIVVASFPLRERGKAMAIFFVSSSASSIRCCGSRSSSTERSPPTRSSSA
jgi:MFS family permease